MLSLAPGLTRERGFEPLYSAFSFIIGFPLIKAIIVSFWPHLFTKKVGTAGGCIADLPTRLSESRMFWTISRLDPAFFFD